MGKICRGREEEKEGAWGEEGASNISNNSYWQCLTLLKYGPIL